MTEKFDNSRRPFFPMMLDLQNKRVLVIGGGKIAARRARTFLKCGAEVVAISPDFCEDFPDHDHVTRICREFSPEDITDEFVLVTAATDNRAVNNLAGIAAKSRNIPVSVADCKTECDYYFPSLINSEANPNIAASICSAGFDVSLTRKLSDKLREVWDSWLREFVKTP